MTWWRAASRALPAALLAATLAVKLAHPAAEAGGLHLRLERFLAAAGLEVAATEFWTGGIPVIRGRRGACQVLVLSAAALGWSGDMVSRLADAGDEVFSVIDGQVFADPPGWPAALRLRWTRLLHGLWLAPRPAVVLAVIARPACDARAWRWAALTAASGPLS